MTQSRSSKQNHPGPGTTTLRWWPLVAAVAGLLIVAVGVWWVQAGAARPVSTPDLPSQTTQSNGPRLSVDRDTIDAGTQPFEQPVSAVFEIQNVGSSPLNILEEPRVELVEGC